MSGSITVLPSGSLRLRVYVGVDSKGREIQRSKTIGPCSDRAAKKALARFAHECESLEGLDHNSDQITFAQLLDQWLDLKTPNLAPGTADDYRRVANAVKPTPLGRRRIRTIRASHIDTFYADLARNELGPARIRRYHHVISGALHQAAKWEWIDRNPATNATPPAIPRIEAAAPDPDDLTRIITAAEPDLATWLIVAAGTGMRPGELAALRWSDIDFDAAELVVHRAIGPAPAGTIGPGGLTGLVEKDTKTHRARPISIDAATLDILADHRRAAVERALAANSTSLAPDSYVFSHEPTGQRPWRPSSVGAQFRRICRRLGIEGLKLYGTRHFHATQLLAAGVDPVTVAGRMGHARTSTTLDIYAHVVRATDQHAADIIGNVIHHR